MEAALFTEVDGHGGGAWRVTGNHTTAVPAYANLAREFELAASAATR